LLFEENNVLDEENKRLLRQYQKERTRHGSSGKQTGSASAKVRKIGEEKPSWCFYTHTYTLKKDLHCVFILLLWHDNSISMV
jgi:hypothetical protein